MRLLLVLTLTGAKALAPRYTGEPPFEEALRAMQTTPLPLSSKITLFSNEQRFLPESHGRKVGSAGYSVFIDELGP